MNQFGGFVEREFDLPWVTVCANNESGKKQLLEILSKLAPFLSYSHYFLKKAVIPLASNIMSMQTQNFVFSLLKMTKCS